MQTKMTDLNPKLKLGAVNYLNMLPYFFDDRDIQLYESPRDLNRDLLNGNLDAGCSSAIFGLRTGLKYIRPGMCISSKDEVQSVFLMPVFATEENRDFWKHQEQSLGSFGVNLTGGENDAANHGFFDTSSMQHVSCHATYLSKVSINNTDSAVSSIILLTNGHSAHSLWLSQTIFKRLNLQTEVKEVLSAELELSDLDLHMKYGDGRTPMCRLLIGDLGLKLFFQANFVKSRSYDLGKLWKQLTGFPCVFAAWFHGAHVCSEDVLTMQQRLSANVRRWQTLDIKAKISLLSEFIARDKNQLLAKIDKFDLVAYLDGINFEMSQKEESTLEIYKKLLRL